MSLEGIPLQLKGSEIGMRSQLEVHAGEENSVHNQYAQRCEDSMA